MKGVILFNRFYADCNDCFKKKLAYFFNCDLEIKDKISKDPKELIRYKHP